MVDFVKILKEKNLKATPQRISVLKELYKNEHPTIERLYEAIREEYPSISLATVYKNIHALKDTGIVIEVNMPNGKMRYDIFTKPHIHIVCKNCNSVTDMDYDEKLFDYQSKLEKESGLKIDRLDVIASVDSCKHCGL